MTPITRNSYKARVEALQVQLKGKASSVSTEKQQAWQECWDLSMETLDYIALSSASTRECKDRIAELENEIEWALGDRPKVSPLIETVLEKLNQIQNTWREVHEEILSVHPIAENIPVIQEFLTQANQARDIMQQLPRVKGL